MDTLKRKWLKYAVIGILVMGFGLSVLGEAMIAKALDKPILNWFLIGTAGLSLIFAGLSVFGQAVVYKTMIDQKKKDL
jgi:sulfite exporter TauE/SafE